MSFTQTILDWYVTAGRKNLPWQQPRTPYRVWISEVMLQQTQVRTVIPYFNRFMQRFPTIKHLADAHEDEVLSYWTGLGYYRRARFLHQAARIVQSEHGGELPANLDLLMQLPGLGRSTAGAILSLGFNQYAPILDGNVKRVLARHEAIDTWPGESSTLVKLWDYASSLTPHNRVAEYNQAMMDLGALVCTRSRPQCQSCPVNQTCKAYASGNPTQYPIKQLKKAMPIRQGSLVIIKNEMDAILLHRRQTGGIWGGLWCFPEWPMDGDLSHWLQQQFHCSLKSTQTLTSFRHTFTHFHWELTFIEVYVKQMPVETQEDLQTLRWFMPGEWQQVGLPQPVSAWLQSEECSHVFA